MDLVRYIDRSIDDGKDLREDDVGKLVLEAENSLIRAIFLARRHLRVETDAEDEDAEGSEDDMRYVPIHEDGVEYDSEGHGHSVIYEYRDRVSEEEFTNRSVHTLAIYTAMRETKKTYFEVMDEAFKQKEEWRKERERKEDERNEQERTAEFEERVARSLAAIKPFDEQGESPSGFEK